MAKAAHVKTAVARGRKRAEAVAKLRRTQLKKRAAVLSARRRTTAARAAPRTPSARAVEAAGPADSRGTLVAEGDSWFDYPLHDVLKALEDRHGFDVESVAHHGDRVEFMAYADGQLDALARLIEKLLRRNELPRAILLSGGGNDIAGSEFQLLLDHADSPIAGVNASIARGIIDERVRFAYIHMISAVTALCERVAGERIPILTHGYAYPIPDGRGFLGGWWFLPGPWLKPGFLEKGFRDQADNALLMRQLIDRFNDMLAAVAALPGFGHVRYVDLRSTLDHGRAYKKHWANELHPTKKGFALVAERIAAEIP